MVSYTVLDYHYAFHLRCFFKFLKASREMFLTILVYASGSYIYYTLPYNPHFYHIQCTYSRIHKDPVLPYNHCNFVVSLNIKFLHFQFSSAANINFDFHLRFNFKLNSNFKFKLQLHTSPLSFNFNFSSTSHVNVKLNL